MKSVKKVKKVLSLFLAFSMIASCVFIKDVYAAEASAEFIRGAVMETETIEIESSSADVPDVPQAEEETETETAVDYPWETDRDSVEEASAESKTDAAAGSSTEDEIASHTEAFQEDTYWVSIAAIENGYIRFADGGRAEKAFEAGRKVTVTVVPDNGYKVKAFSILDASTGKIMGHKESADNTFTFTMISRDIVVSAVTARITVQEELPDAEMPEIAEKDTTTYISENMDEAIVGEVADYSQNELKDIEEDPIEILSSVRNVNLSATAHSIFINFSLADASMIEEPVTIDDVWEKKPEAFLASYSMTATLYAVEENEDCFVAFIDPSIMNGAGKILHADFTNTDTANPENFNDRVQFDKETGIAYIPKSLYFNEDGEEIPYDLLTQVLIAYDINDEENITNGINVSIENSDSSVDIIAEEQRIYGISLDVTTTIPVATPETADNLDMSRVRVYVNDNTNPISLEENDYFFDEETGELTISMTPVTLYSVRVVIEGQSLLGKLVDSLTITASATKEHRVTSVGQMNTLPYGKVIATDRVAVNQLYKKTVGMKYIPELPSSSSATYAAMENVYEYCHYNYASNTLSAQEYLFAKNGGTLQDYLNHDGFGYITEAGSNPLSLFNFLMKTPDGEIASTTDSSARITMDIASEAGYLVLHCTHNISAAQAIGQIDIPANASDFKNTEVWMRVLAINRSGNTPYIVIGFCGPYCSAQAAYGVYKINLEEETTKTVEIKLTKKSSSTSVSQGAEGYSLAGAVYTLYEGILTDDTGKVDRALGWKNAKKVDTYATNSKGVFTIPNLALTTTAAASGYATGYYLKETEASPGYGLDETIWCIRAIDAGSGQVSYNVAYSKDKGKTWVVSVPTTKVDSGFTVAINSTEPVSTVQINLIKKPVDPSIEGNGYSLEGAVYTLYKGIISDEDGNIDRTAGWMNAKKVRSYTTDAKGTFTSAELSLTTAAASYGYATGYFIRETAASPGYGLDETIWCIRAIDAGNGNVSYNVACSTDNGKKWKTSVSTTKVESGFTIAITSMEPLLNIPFELILQKMDADTKKPVAAGSATLEGALFQVDFYDNTDGETTGDAVRTWVFQTDENGKLDCSDESFLVADLSDEICKSQKTGELLYPIGTYRIKEIQPPLHYQLAGTMVFSDFADEIDIADGLVFVIKNVDGEARVTYGGQVVSASNLSLNVYDEVYKGRIRVIKYDDDGKTPLAGVSFRLTGEDGSEYEGTTDGKGEIVFEGLIPQHYILTETSTVEGHVLLAESIEIVIPLDMSKEEADAAHADFSEAVWDEAAKTYCFYEVTYEVTNSSSLKIPVAGGETGWLYMVMIVAFIMIGGGICVVLRRRQIS